MNAIVVHVFMPLMKLIVFAEIAWKVVHLLLLLLHVGGRLAVTRSMIDVYDEDEEEEQDQT